MHARITKGSGHRISEVQIIFYVVREALNEKAGHWMFSLFYNLLLKREINYKLGTGYVVHWSKVSTFKGVYYINVRNFLYRAEGRWCYIIFRNVGNQNMYESNNSKKSLNGV